MAKNTTKRSLSLALACLNLPPSPAWAEVARPASTFGSDSLYGHVAPTREIQRAPVSENCMSFPVTVPVFANARLATDGRHGTA